MENENKVETVETENTQEKVVEPEVVEETTKENTEETHKVKSSEVLRELSKTFAVNLFDENGLTMLKEKLDNKDNEYNMTKAQLDETLKNVELFQQKEQDYKVRLAALELGFKSEQLDEVLALARVNVKEGQTINDGLKAVKEKYGGVFVGNKNIGLQMNDLKGDKPNLPRTEQERYLANNPRVQYYNKNKK